MENKDDKVKLNNVSERTIWMSNKLSNNYINHVY